MNKKKDKETKKRNETHIIKNEEKCKVNVRERVSVRGRGLQITQKNNK